MKVLLVGINAKYIHSSPALYYLKSYAIKMHSNKQFMRDTIEIMEFTINQEKDEIIRQIYTKKADVIAFSCYLWNVSYVHAIVQVLGKICPETDIWLGGPEVSFDPESQLEKYPSVRGIMAGEGEQNFYQLVCAYVKGRNDLPRILQADESLSFDEVPFPYEDLALFQNRIVYYETSRGCPFGCTYCLSSVDTKVRLRSLPLVEKELQQFLDARIPLVKFVDRTFNCNPAHTLGILTYLMEHDNGITCFHFEMAAELITEEEMQVLSRLRPGQVQIEVGIQTTNCETLKAIRRHADMDHLSSIIKRLLSFQNMHVHVDLIAGLPYEDLPSFRKSFQDVYALHANELQLGFLKVLKGSPMESQAAEYEILYQGEPPYEVLSTKWLSFEDVIELKGVENVLEVYYNSGQFLHAMQCLEKLPCYQKDAYQLYYDLYRYYEQNGYLGLSQNRYERYRILREFAISKMVGDEKKQACFTEKLLHDLYLRDNVKSRPDYGEKGLVDKDSYKAFFVSGRYKSYLSGYEAYTSAQVAKMVHIEKTAAGYTIYDYMHRSPLSGNATSICIESLE